MSQFTSGFWDLYISIITIVSVLACGVFLWSQQKAKIAANAEDIEAKMRALRIVGVPYSDAEISKSKDELKGKTEMDALIAYLQVLGTAVKRGN